MLLGIDVGTSSTKAVVLDGEGVVVSTGSAEHPISRPRPGWSEQDPRDWWGSTCRAVGAALAAGGLSGSDIKGVGLSGQMHGSVLLDRQTLNSGGQSESVLRPALLWNDQRTQSECEWIEQRAGGRAKLVKMVGNAALPGFTLPKWLWIKRHEPEVWSRVALAMMPKDYVRFRMTGAPATDVGDAAGTLVFDVDRRTWSGDALSGFEIDPAILPPALESASPAGSLTPWAAAALGLAPGTPVVAGSGDNQCGAIGAGVVEPGLLLATLGTSGVLYAHAQRPWRDDSPSGTPPGRVHTMCAADGGSAGGRDAGHWSITGCTLSAAGALAWARESVFGGESYDVLLGQAGAVPAGCEGLVFLPYLSGERCPHPDPSASGAWIGLTARHTRGHMVRAVLEGVALTMAQILSIMQSMQVPARVCRLGGGGVRSPLWRDILTAALTMPIQTMEAEEGPAFGAALLAGVGIGHWPSVAEACRATVRVAHEHEPRAELVRAFSGLRSIHESCYTRLAPVMGELARRRG